MSETLDLVPVVDNVPSINNAQSLEPENLPLPEILRLALERNPDINQALYREEQAEYKVKQGAAYKLPTVDVSALIGPELNDPSSNDDVVDDATPGRTVTLRAVQLLYDGGTSSHELKRRKQVSNSSELETRIVTEDVVSETVEFYTSVLRYQRSHEVANSFISEMQTLTEKLGKMNSAGAASKVELDFAKARLASARAAAANTIASLNDSISNLEFVTGELPEFVAVAPMSLDNILLSTLNHYLEIAQLENSQIQLNKSNRDAQVHRIQSEKGKLRPSLSFQVTANALADEGGHLASRSNYEAKLKVSYLLFDGFSRRNGIRGAQSRMKELDYEEQSLIKGLSRKIKLSYHQIKALQLNLDATEDEIFSNKELQRLNRKQLSLGEVNIIELIDVEERLFNAQANRERVVSDIYRNYYELMIDSGRVLDLINAPTGVTFN